MSLLNVIVAMAQSNSALPVALRLRTSITLPKLNSFPHSLSLVSDIYGLMFDIFTLLIWLYIFWRFISPGSSGWLFLIRKRVGYKASATLTSGGTGRGRIKVFSSSTCTCLLVMCLGAFVIIRSALF